MSRLSQPVPHFVAAAPAESDAANAAREAIVPAAPWIERLARVGYTAKAVLYTVVGVLALRAALGDGGKTIGSRGALVELVRHPYGAVILVVIAAGLFGYAAWRIIDAVLDPERQGTSAKGVAIRASYAVRGLVHAVLGVQAVRVAIASERRSGQAVEAWTARALGMPLGKWLVVAAGLTVAGYGCYQLYRAWAAKLSRQLDFSAISRDAGSWLIKVCRFGIGARGVVFIFVGGYLARAGLVRNAKAAADTGEALRGIEHQPFGEWMLAVVAAGLIAYGAYEVVQSRYRAIRPA
jgi:hypothetical protein